MSQSSSLRGKVVLVTGASLGIGRAVAQAFAQCQAKVVINYRSSEASANDLVAEIRAAGGEAVAHQADVAEHEQVQGLVERAVREFGRLDIAISNAAYSDREAFHEADLAGFRRTVDVTMWGAFYVLREATRQMVTQQTPGAIVLVSSPHAFIPVPRAMAYNMSKAALEQMAKTAAIELAEHRIRVNTIQPGWTDTPGERKFATDDTLERAGAGIPLGRLGTPAEMAEAIKFLADPQNEYMTGATLLLDGGISLPWWANRGSAAPE